MVCGRRTVHGQQKEEALRTGRQLLIGARAVPELEQPPENTICQNPLTRNGIRFKIFFFFSRLIGALPVTYTKEAGIPFAMCEVKLCLSISIWS
jgi:hypothetical protein